MLPIISFIFLTNPTFVFGQRPLVLYCAEYKGSRLLVRDEQGYIALGPPYVSSAWFYGTNNNTAWDLVSRHLVDSSGMVYVRLRNNNTFGIESGPSFCGLNYGAVPTYCRHDLQCGACTATCCP